MSRKEMKVKSEICGYLALSRDCNQECIYCSIEKSTTRKSADEVKKELSDYKERGVSQIAFTGGEPTIHPDIIDIVSFGASLGLDLRIITNGVKLSEPSFVRALSDAGLQRVVLSVHSFDEEISDAVSGKAGHHEARMRALKNILDDGRMELNINTTIIRQNFRTLDALAERIVEARRGHESKLTHVNFNFVDACGEAAKNPDCVPKYSEIELKLHKAIMILTEAGISVMVERVPLCYMRGFANRSSDANRLSGTEHYFIKRFDGEQEYRPNDSKDIPQSCKVCFLKSICGGVTQSYAKAHGHGELYPVFEDPIPSINRMMKSKKARSRVHCRKVEGYEFGKVMQALEDGFERMGGLQNLVRKDAKVLIKPNMFVGLPPERCATTHPIVVQALIRIVSKQTKHIIVADGSGLEAQGKELDVLEKTGIGPVCRSEGVRCENLNLGEFLQKRLIDYETVNITDISRHALESDLIINVPKLKTHGITFLTGAVKNLFGTVHLQERIYMHSSFQDPARGGNQELFSKALVDVYSYLQHIPMLHVMDAIESMEGEEGPLRGSPVKTKFLLMSKDAVALDSVAASILGYQPLSIPTTRIASTRMRGLGDPECIELTGDELGLVEFRKSSLFKTINRVKLLKGYGTEFYFRPMVDSTSCRKSCEGFCIAACPVAAIRRDASARIEIDGGKCIGCMVCQNVCPHAAILKREIRLDRSSSGDSSRAGEKDIP